MQYLGYTIQLTQDRWVIRNTFGKYLCSVDTDVDAYNYIDDLVVSKQETYIEFEDNQKFWYVCRTPKLDKNNYNNCQYYDGKMFKYNSYNIKYLTKVDAESIVKKYTNWDDYHIYAIYPKSKL